MSIVCPFPVYSRMCPHYLLNITREERECMVFYALLGCSSKSFGSTKCIHTSSCLSCWLVYLTYKTFPIMYLKSHLIYLFDVKNVYERYIFCQMKKDSVASLVHNNLFCSLVTRTGYVFSC